MKCENVLLKSYRDEPPQKTPVEVVSVPPSRKDTVAFSFAAPCDG
jgi:hypothetical protein